MGIKAKAKTTGAKHTSASDYHTLSKGDQGEAVRQMQKRLIELDYLDGSADGVFGPKTLAAVRSFASQNGITIYNDALPEMQALLFSDKALAYIEPWIPLMIGEQLSWDPVDGVNTFFFKVDLINTSKKRTIKGYELKAYLTDVWGERVYGSPTYSKTDQIHVAPGESIKCSSFNFENWASVDTVYVDVSKIAFDDGEVRKVENIDYFACHILK